MSGPNSGSLPGNGGVEEWLELESDPGVFSLLVEDYGVRGVKVEEVYDVSQKFESEVFGFVFLFRYELTDRRARKKARDMTEIDSYVLDDGVVNKMFFAHQIITNSCATHALLSVLLNCRDLDIGPNLQRLREFTEGLDPESKGFAIANMMELAHIHNKHARPPRTMAPPIGGRKSSIVSSAFALLPETYHYVSFVPINGRLFELDGLKEYPMDHGPWGEHENWTDLFQRMVTQRFLESQDCLFNLMALVPDPVPQISECLKRLQKEQTMLVEMAAKLARQVIAEREQEKKSAVASAAVPMVPSQDPLVASEEQTKGSGVESPAKERTPVVEQDTAVEESKPETKTAAEPDIEKTDDIQDQSAVVNQVKAAEYSEANADPVQSLQQPPTNSDPVQSAAQASANIDSSQSTEDSAMALDPVTEHSSSQSADESSMSIDPVQTTENGEQSTASADLVGSSDPSKTAAKQASLGQPLNQTQSAAESDQMDDQLQSPVSMYQDQPAPRAREDQAGPDCSIHESESTEREKTSDCTENGKCESMSDCAGCDNCDTANDNCENTEHGKCDSGPVSTEHGNCEKMSTSAEPISTDDSKPSSGTTTQESGISTNREPNTKKEATGKEVQSTLNADTEPKEEPMDLSEPPSTETEAALLNKVSKNLPANSSELDAIADTPLDGDVSVDDRLRIAVAKVVKNYKEAEEHKQKLKEEIETKQRFRVEHSRRIHDYDAFIFDFVKCLAQNKQLPERVLRRPSVAPPLRGGFTGRRKRKRGVSRKPRTTLLLNGSKVD